MITKENKDKAIAKVARNKNDVGSPEVQVAILTERIKEVTEHVKNNKHDFMAKRGLMQMVGKRKKLLKYLETTDFELYKKTLSKGSPIPKPARRLLLPLYIQHTLMLYTVECSLICNCSRAPHL